MMHVPREPAEYFRDPLHTGPMGKTFMSWDSFKSMKKLLTYKRESFREEPQKTELGPGSPWAFKRSWLKLKAVLLGVSSVQRCGSTALELGCVRVCMLLLMSLCSSFGVALLFQH